MQINVTNPSKNQISEFLSQFLRIVSRVELSHLFWCDADRDPKKFDSILILLQKTQTFDQSPKTAARPRP